MQIGFPIAIKIALNHAGLCLNTCSLSSGPGSEGSIVLSQKYRDCKGALVAVSGAEGGQIRCAIPARSWT
jgi:hypothetical protein